METIDLTVKYCWKLVVSSIIIYITKEAYFSVKMGSFDVNTEQITSQLVLDPPVLFKNCITFDKNNLDSYVSCTSLDPSSLENRNELRSRKVLWMLPTLISCSKSFSPFSSKMQRLLKRVMLSKTLALSILGNLYYVSIYLWVWFKSIVWFHYLSALSTMPKNYWREEFPFKTESMLRISSRVNCLKSRL